MQSQLIKGINRLFTIKNADIIFFIDEGKVKAQGKFKELIKTYPDFEEFFKAEIDNEA